jgi:hypothetical protein
MGHSPNLAVPTPAQGRYQSLDEKPFTCVLPVNRTPASLN